MYLVDTNVISEVRKSSRANPGVRAFFDRAVSEGIPVYVSVVTVGELRRGVELIRHRGDVVQAETLDAWLTQLLLDYEESILEFGEEAAQVWGRLRVPHPENALDKQIAATALVHDLTVVTRNDGDFAETGVRVLNPFRDAR
ncbi:MAG: type II toxin-antitoxin system VapC family toxin [Deltaproteobacteria bacterium]|nr:type II toxin-antitoxin system VapC family toxin [Deltaproteobacteria bacterium]